MTGHQKTKKKNKGGNMKKKDIYKLVMIALAIFAVLTVVFVTVAIVQPPQRSTKAVKYDLDCVAGRSRNPLVECRE